MTQATPPSSPSPASSPSSRERREQELLVVRCQLGERDAFEDLVARWHTPLWRFLRGMSTDAGVAEEVLQETWLRILRGIGRLRDASRLQPWLFSIARRAFADRLRRRYADKDVEPLDTQDATAQGDPVVEVLAAEEVESLRAALADLSPPDREAMILFYLQEFSLREVADILEIPEGTVKSRLHRGRHQLRAELRTRGIQRAELRTKGIQRAELRTKGIQRAGLRAKGVSR